MWSPFVRSSGDNRTYRIPYVATVPERKGSCRTGAFEICSVFVRESFGMPAFLPASLHACRYGSPHCRTGCVRDTFEIRLGFVRDSFGMPAFLPASLQVVRYCTAQPLIVGRVRSGFVWDSFGIRSRFVGDSFGMPAFLRAFIPRVFVHQSYQG